MTQHPEDEILVKRARDGDKRAFDLLVLRYQQRVARIVARFIKDPHEVLDVTQEVFIKAYKAISNFRGDSAFYTWLYRIAINTAKNTLSSWARRPPREDIDAEIAEQQVSANKLQNHATPEHELLSAEIAETIDQALDDLPEDLRTAITLRELDGMSYDEIAQVMSCPIGTVRSRIFRAREAIDKRLKPLLEA